VRSEGRGANLGASHPVTLTLFAHGSPIHLTCPLEDVVGALDVP
jgi:hypothetical protein